MTNTQINNKNNVPVYVEQQIIQTDLQATDILKTKISIPELVKKLDLPLGEDIPYPVYISPAVINRKTTYGGITIENKKEIIIDKPSSKDQETQTDLARAADRGLNRRLNEANALINNIQNLLGINDLNNLPVLPEGETLISLLERPTRVELLQAEKNRANDLQRKNEELQGDLETERG
ncbi:11630_t:CDS:2 [Scutellospora calospora]|uniref:11630_t:CDS:1 n=1 Tax=Scutellospora calospora TaxID=85575 RepID=A0ACA9NGU9_9GLOM|nr:11630_t:CDS:2 [Scutellospora calospora]